MISFLIKYKKIILIVTLVFFLGSIVYLGLDAYSRGGYKMTAAQVGSQKISYRQLNRATENHAKVLRNQGMDVDEDLMTILRQQALSMLISEEVLSQSAKKAEMSVSDYEIAFNIKQMLFGPKEPFNKNAYTAHVRRAMGVSPAEFEQQMRQQILANRYRISLYSFYKLTPEEIKYAYVTQHGNMKGFDNNKDGFVKQLMDTKMETAQKSFFDDFNQRVSIKTFLQD